MADIIEQIVEFVDERVADPTGWQINRHEHEDALIGLLTKLVATKPAELPDLIKALHYEYPYIIDNVSLIHKGEKIFNDIMNALDGDPEPKETDEDEDLPQGFSAEVAKLHESKISLFNKLVEHTKNMQALAGNITGMTSSTEKMVENLGSHGRRKKGGEGDRPGAAQELLMKNR